MKLLFNIASRFATKRNRSGVNLHHHAFARWAPTPSI
jgi:hypothetical protein